MAYSAGDFLVNVQGTLDQGEIWSNTWCVQGATTDADKVAAVTALHQFYEAIKAYLADSWHARVATGTDLVNNLTADYAWADQVGALASDALPTQCAVRVSLDDGQGHRGGPYLNGWAATALTAGGLLEPTIQTAVRDEVEDLSDELVSNGMVLSLHRPSVGGVVQVTRVRIGQRFDIIRKRANEILENYATVAIP